MRWILNYGSKYFDASFFLFLTHLLWQYSRDGKITAGKNVPGVDWPLLILDKSFRNTRIGPETSLRKKGTWFTRESRAGIIILGKFGKPKVYYMYHS